MVDFFVKTTIKKMSGMSAMIAPLPVTAAAPFSCHSYMSDITSGWDRMKFERNPRVSLEFRKKYFPLAVKWNATFEDRSENCANQCYTDLFNRWYLHLGKDYEYALLHLKYDLTTMIGRWNDMDRDNFDKSQYMYPDQRYLRLVRLYMDTLLGPPLPSIYGGGGADEQTTTTTRVVDRMRELASTPLDDSQSQTERIFIINARVLMCFYLNQMKCARRLIERFKNNEVVLIQ
jgi:hypothetical protein